MRLLLYFIIWCSGKQELNSQHQFIQQVYMKNAFVRVDYILHRAIINYCCPLKLFLSIKLGMDSSHGIQPF